MLEPELPERAGRQGFKLPRRAIPFVWALIVFVIQILLPWAISLIGPRFGWSQRSPGWWNIAGLLAVFIGLAAYMWCLLFHFRSYRVPVQVSFSPPQLVVAGPYRFSRNPMYVSGLFAWLGWSVFYGSPAVFTALLLLWLVFTHRVIPAEERLLETRFGQDYLAYKRMVRRWVGRR